MVANFSWESLRQGLVGAQRSHGKAVGDHEDLGRLSWKPWRQNRGAEDGDATTVIGSERVVLQGGVEVSFENRTNHLGMEQTTSFPSFSRHVSHISKIYVPIFVYICFPSLFPYLFPYPTFLPIISPCFATRPRNQRPTRFNSSRSWSPSGTQRKMSSERSRPGTASGRCFWSWENHETIGGEWEQYA